MPIITMAVGEERGLESPLAAIRVDAGSVLITGSEINPVALEVGEKFDGEDRTGLRLRATDGASLVVAYGGDVAADNDFSREDVLGDDA